MKQLLMPREVDRVLRYPRGRSLRLARGNKLPHIKLPDGEIRFDPDEIDKLLVSTGGSRSTAEEANHE